MFGSTQTVSIFDALTDTEKVFRDEAVAVSEVAEKVKLGYVVLLPTDTVYGVACSAENPSSIEDVFVLKRRESTKTLPVLVSGLEMADHYFGPLSLDERFRLEALASQLWPGALTVVVSSPRTLPRGVQRVDGSVALRSPGDSFSSLVVRDVPLACTSANRSGGTPVTNFIQAKALLKESLLKDLSMSIQTLVVGDERPMAEKASTLVDIRTTVPQILREGPISYEEISKVLSA